MQTRRYDALLLDFGGVCLLNPVELHGVAEQRLGLPSGSLTWRGPVDPSTDPQWRAMVAGKGLTERQYWADRAAEVGRAAGSDLSLQDYMKLLYEPPRPELIREGAVSVASLARQAGLNVSVLTNDLRAFHGREWERRIPFLRDIDHIVDCSDSGFLKPDPRAYEQAIDIVGAVPQRILFVDDQPLNVEGALAVGLDSMWFDIANAEQSWRDVAAKLSLE